jgi:hypothetical protein
VYKSNNSSFGSSSGSGSFNKYGSGSSKDSPVKVGEKLKILLNKETALRALAGLWSLFQTQRSTIQLRLKSRR